MPGIEGPGIEGGGGGGGDTLATYLTLSDETGTLPNSRQLIAGDNIAFDTSTPGELGISAAGGNAALGAEVAFNATAGDNDDVDPGDPIEDVGRLLVTGADATSVITGIIAGGDGQLLQVFNEGADVLTLANEDGGSASANQILSIDDLILPPGGSALLCYSSNLNKWVVT